MRRASVKLKLVLMASSLALVGAGASLAGIASVHHVAAVVEDTTAYDAQIASMAQDLRAGNLSMRRAEKDMLLGAADLDQIKAHNKRYFAAYNETDARLQEMAALAREPADLADIEAMKAGLETYARGMAVVRGEMLAGQITSPEVANARIEEHKEAIQAMERRAQSLRSRASVRLAAAEARQQVLMRRVMAGMGGLVGACLLVGAVLTRAVGRVAARMQRATEQAQAAGEALAARNDAMRLVLDNVQQGLLTIDAAGVLSAERSSVVERWFGAIAPGETLEGIFRRTDPGAADFFALGWEAIQEGLLPLDLLLAQLPCRLSSGYLTLQVDYHAIPRPDGGVGCLVVLSDITARLENERLQAEQSEVSGLFQRMLKDQPGVLGFLREAEALVGLIATEGGDLATARRRLHTLKGNLSLFGISSIAGFVHQLEDEIEESRRPLSTERLLELRERVDRLCGSIRVLADDEEHRIELDAEELRVALVLLAGEAPRHEALAALRRWELEPARKPLSRLADSVRYFAGQLGKQVAIEQRHNRVRLDPAAWSPLWSGLAHVVRNALDHGLETPAERAAAGKDPVGRLVLETQLCGGVLVVGVADDGRGIDWEAIRRKALQRGLPAQSPGDLVAALFTDGLSTREEVTELSGRGVGMAVMQELCQARGGSLQVESEPGRGTRFEFRFPLAEAAGARLAG